MHHVECEYANIYKKLKCLCCFYIIGGNLIVNGVGELLVLDGVEGVVGVVGV